MLQNSRNIGVPPKSLLPLQVIANLHGWLLPIFLVLEICIFVFKGSTLPYPPYMLGLETFLLIVLVINDIVRIFFTKKGNLIESTKFMLIALALTIGTAVLLIYFMLLQVYVLRIEFIVTIIYIAIVGIETLLSIAAMSRFPRD